MPGTNKDPEEMTLDLDDLPGSPQAKDFISPAGMRMRSGRKKRRRSKETSGLTPQQKGNNKKIISRDSTAPGDTPAKRRKTRASASPQRKEGDDDDGVDNDDDSAETEEEMDSEEEEKLENTHDNEHMKSDEEESEEEQGEDDAEMPAGAEREAVVVAGTVAAADLGAAPAAVAAAPLASAPVIPSSVDHEPTPFTSPEPIPVAAAAATALPPMDLRMISEQTPGKQLGTRHMADTPYDNRYRGHVEVEDVVQEPPSVTRVTQKAEALQAMIQDVGATAESRVETPVRRLFRVFQTGFKEIIIPNSEGLDLDDDDLSQQSSIVSRTTFWFMVFLIVQAVCFQFWLNPIMTSVNHLSESSVLLYKDIFGVQPPIIQKNITIEIEVPVEVKQAAPPTKKKPVTKKKVTIETTPTPGDEKLIEQNMQDLAAAKESLVAETATTVNVVTAQVTQQLDEVKSALLEKRSSLEKWDAALSEAEAEIKDLLAEDGVPNTATLAGALDKLQTASKVKINAGLAGSDPKEVPMWEVMSSTGCPQPPSRSKTDPLVSKEDVIEGATMLKQRAQETVRDTIEDPDIQETVKGWVTDELEDRDGVAAEDAEVDADDDDDDMGLLVGITEDEAKDIIDSRIEADMADTVGLLDVASLYNGAEVIRSRSARATTPSLVQSLPLLNRFLAATKLRFYGHGPEAALSPTVPSDALGQCWSFENTSKSKNVRWRNVYKRDKANGKHATLTIRLAKATTAKRVIIDHVGGDDRVSSAIREFRVIGYTDSKAQDNPIHLGAFKYRQDGAASQQFEISETHEQLQSMTLAIDSTYSKDYACLYRFRVLQD